MNYNWLHLIPREFAYSMERDYFLFNISVGRNNDWHDVYLEQKWFDSNEERNTNNYNPDGILEACGKCKEEGNCEIYFALAGEI